MAAKETPKVPLVSITVFRDGQFVNVPVGKPFNFYEAELKDIGRAEVAEGKLMLRDLQTEEAPATAASKVKADEL